MMPALTGVDYVILAIVAVSAMTGLFRGFIKELMALGIWLIALWGATKLASLGAEYLKPWIHQEEFRLVVSFVLVTISILLLGGLLTSLLAFLIERSGLSGTDRLLGMIFGFGRAIFIISLIILVGRMTSFPMQKYAKQSQLFAYFTPVVDWMSSYAPLWLSKIKSIDPQKSQMQMINEVSKINGMN